LGVISHRIRDVVVAGGGVAAALAAVAIARRIPGVRVTLVDTGDGGDPLEDRFGSALPSIRAFHARLGVEEATIVGRTGGGFRLGARLEGWTGPASLYYRCHGQHGRALGGAAFHQLWLRAKTRGLATPFDAFSASAVLADQGRFAYPSDDPASPLAGLDYGLQLHLPAYRAALHGLGRAAGVIEVAGTIAKVERRATDGFVEALRLADGRCVGGDLFIDCTGRRGSVRKALEAGFELWSKQLPIDRLIFAEGPADPVSPAYERLVALPGAWRREAVTQSGGVHALAYASERLSEDNAQRELRMEAACAPSAAVNLQQGRLEAPWTANCVAIGAAAVAIEPLAGANLHLVVSAIDRLIRHWPRADCAPSDIAAYNRRATAEADRVRDYTQLHYHAARRDDPFWRKAAAAPLSPALVRTLELFRERGRLPVHDEEVFDREDWLAVLLGQGVFPRRIDPLTDAVSPAEEDRLMRRLRQSIAQAVSPRPSHVHVLDQIREASRR
jgi:tryptophan halogenase